MELAQWINKRYLVDTQKLAKAYQKATPYPHLVLEEFLVPAKLRALEKALREQPFMRKASDLFSFAQTPDLLTTDDPTIQAFLAMLQSKEFTTLMRTITGCKLSGEIDAMGVIYADTDRLLCHDDELEGRAVAYILNLSSGFTSKSGGALALLDHDKKGRPTKVVKRITPTKNTFAFFTVSKISHHMVEEVLEQKERLTIGGWLHG